MKFRVKVEVRKYLDLSDKPTERWFPIAASDEDDAVYKMRELLDAEREKDARASGTKEGVAAFVNKAGTKRYLGRVLLGHSERVG